ncbi:VanW family protein [Caldicellulosiruptoraceae bacterium PP1]
MKKKVLLISFLILLIFTTSISGYFLYNTITSLLNTNKIYKGIYIEDVYVSGLTKSQAYEIIKAKYLDTIGNKSIIINIQNDRFTYSLKYFDVNLNIKEAIDEAFSIGRNGNFLERLREIKKIYDNPVKISLSYSYNNSKIKRISEKLALRYYKKSINASIKRINNKFVITNSSYGTSLDYKKLAEEMKKLLDNKKGGEINCKLNLIRPTITEEDLRKITDVIGEFTTKFNASNIPRSINIEVAANKINGNIVLPGETYSLSNVLSPVTVENGYKIAKVIVGNEFVDGVGGGLCQIATTLYNAVLQAQLKVVERLPHSALVSYVPPGRDATVASGSIDFKFKNNSDTIIYIESFRNKDTVTVRLYGKNSHIGEVVKFENEIVEKIPYKVVYKNDPTLPKGVKKRKGIPQGGLKVKTYMSIYKDGILISKKLLSYDYYKPVDDVYLVGTKEVLTNKDKINDDR